MREKRILFRSIIALLILFCGAYVLRMIAFKKAPCKNEMKLSQLQKNDIKVQYLDSSEDWTEAELDDFRSNEIEVAKTCEYIFKAKPTGKIYFNRSVILQEVRVEKVIRGACDYSTIWINNGLAATLTYDEGNIILTGMPRSFMQEDCEYLIFCEAADINKYSDRKVFQEQEGMWLCCYNVTRDCDTTVNKEYPDYNDYDKNIEYYNSNKGVLEYYIETKKILMEMYLK